MERLTHVLGKDYCAAHIQKVINKLGILEDLEDDLGISFPIIVAAYKSGIYELREGKIEWVPYDDIAPDFNRKIIDYYYTHDEDTVEYKFADYDQTWSLVKERLQHNLPKEEG